MKNFSEITFPAQSLYLTAGKQQQKTEKLGNEWSSENSRNVEAETLVEAGMKCRSWDTNSVPVAEE